MTKEPLLFEPKPIIKNDSSSLETFMVKDQSLWITLYKFLG